MAQVKVSAEPALASSTIDTADLLYVVDVSATLGKKITVDAFFKGCPSTLDIAVAGALLIGPSVATSVVLGASGVGTTVSGDLTVADAKNVVLNTTTGTKIGSGATQKLAFWNATPIVQPANTVDYVTMLTNLGLRASGGTAAATFPGALSCAALTATSVAGTGTVALTDDMTVTEAKNLVLGTATGTKIGTATTQKLGFFNATPIVQPANTVDYVTSLVNLGFRASGGTAAATFPGVVSVGLNLRTVAFTGDTYGAAVTIDVTKGLHVIAASNTTSAASTFTPSAAGTAGDLLTLVTEADATGTVTVTFSGTLHSSGTQATTASHFSTISFISDGTRWVELSRTTALA